MFSKKILISVLVVMAVSNTTFADSNALVYPSATDIRSLQYPHQAQMPRAPVASFGQPNMQQPQFRAPTQNMRMRAPTYAPYPMPRGTMPYAVPNRQYPNYPIQRPSNNSSFPFSNNMMPFGNGSNNGFNPFSGNNMPFTGNSFSNPMNNMFGNNNNRSMPFFGNTRNKSRKKAWGDTRNIWPDFYTDFTDEAWDTVTSGPRDLGEMPGGWRFPYISTPDPVTVSDAITNQFPPIMEEGGNMMDFSDWGVFDNK